MSKPAERVIEPWHVSLRLHVPLAIMDAGVEMIEFDVAYDPRDELPDDPVITIGKGKVWLVELDNVPRGHMDAIDADLSQIEAVIRSTKFTERYEPISPILIIDKVWLELSWRGHALGRVIVARLIAVLGSGLELVAILPSPFLDDDDTIDSPEHRAAVKKLQRYWKPLGFEHTGGGVFVLDLRLRVPSEAVAAIATEYREREGF